jgi:hypothetical protein
MCYNAHINKGDNPMSTFKEKLAQLKEKAKVSFKKIGKDRGILKVGTYTGTATYALTFDQDGNVITCDCYNDTGKLPKTIEEQAERKAAVMARLNAKGYKYDSENIDIRS